MTPDARLPKVELPVVHADGTHVALALGGRVLGLYSSTLPLPERPQQPRQSLWSQPLFVGTYQ